MKSATQSATIWLNLIPTVIAVLTTLSGDTLVSSHPKIASALATAIFVLNILNRFRTVEPVALFPKKDNT